MSHRRHRSAVRSVLAVVLSLAGLMIVSDAPRGALAANRARGQIVLGPPVGRAKAPLGRQEGFTTGQPGMEAEFVSRINSVRAGKGLPTLAVHDNLVSKARGWSRTMAEAGEIWHSNLPDGITVPWKRLGENVGVGPDVPGLHDAFVASPKHYENLVNPDFEYIGIGITTTSDGTIYVNQMFMQPPASAAPAPPQSSDPPSGGQASSGGTKAPKSNTPPATRAPSSGGPAPTAAPAPAVTSTTAVVDELAAPVAARPISRREATESLPPAAIIAALVGLALGGGLLALRFARPYQRYS